MVGGPAEAGVAATTNTNAMGRVIEGERRAGAVARRLHFRHP
jgi:hypothetical protein